MKKTKLSMVVKALRKEYGLTQKDLAMKSGVGLCFVRNLEQGKPTLRMDKVNQLLDLFNYELTATKKVITLTEGEMRGFVKNVVSEPVDDSGTQDSQVITEMAKVDIVYDKKIGYIIAIWGNLLNDKITPHVNIWKASDAKNEYKNFNLELSLIDILVNDKLVLLRKTDIERNIDEVGRTENWTPYGSIKRVIEKQFADENADLLGEIITTWNKERDIEKTYKGGNPLKEWMDERNLKPLPKYEKYFIKK